MLTIVSARLLWTLLNFRTKGLERDAKSVKSTSSMMSRQQRKTHCAEINIYGLASRTSMAYANICQYLSGEKILFTCNGSPLGISSYVGKLVYALQQTTQR